MELENRYMVLKCRDVVKYLDVDEKLTLFKLCDAINEGRRDNGKPTINALVIESDWPEYGPALDALAKRVDRIKLIEQLNKSFMSMPTWVKSATKHAMGAPEINPKTKKPFMSFREVINEMPDEALQILRDDFEDNGDLIKD